ncbi:MAG: TrmB family transcriptional regulator [Promethearchaeota archaeon]
MISLLSDYMSEKTPEKIPDQISDEIKASLKAIGLTEYEVNIYLTLTACGPLNARELADKSTVPYSRIYNILQMLEEKEFILKEEESRPSRYFAKSPDEALVIARQRNQATFNAHAEKIIEELTPIYQQKDVPIKIALYVLRGKASCFARLESIFRTTNKALFLASSDIGLLGEIFEHVSQLRARGIRDIRVLLEESYKDDEEKTELVKKYAKIANVRSRNQIFGTGIVKDEGEDAFLVLTRKFFSSKSYFGIQTDHLAFGPAAMDYFGYLYDTADDVEF